MAGVDECIQVPARVVFIRSELRSVHLLAEAQIFKTQHLCGTAGAPSWVLWRMVSPQG